MTSFKVVWHVRYFVVYYVQCLSSKALCLGPLPHAKTFQHKPLSSTSDPKAAEDTPVSLHCVCELGGKSNVPGEVVPTGRVSRRRLWPKPGVAEAGVSETGLDHTPEIAAPRNNGNRLTSTWTC